MGWLQNCDFLATTIAWWPWFKRWGVIWSTCKPIGSHIAPIRCSYSGLPLGFFARFSLSEYIPMCTGKCRWHPVFWRRVPLTPSQILASCVFDMQKVSTLSKPRYLGANRFYKPHVAVPMCMTTLADPFSGVGPLPPLPNIGTSLLHHASCVYNYQTVSTSFSLLVDMGFFTRKVCCIVHCMVFGNVVFR